MALPRSSFGRLDYRAGVKKPVRLRVTPPPMSPKHVTRFLCAGAGVSMNVVVVPSTVNAPVEMTKMLFAPAKLVAVATNP
jgi:hypothetical protein